MSKISGRQVEVGIGIETAAGTAVGAADYFKWDSFSMAAVSDKIILTSARGIRNKGSNSKIIKKYGKGSVEFSPTVDILPYIFGLTFGTRASANAAGEAAVYDHTFTINNNNAAMKTATMLVKQGGVQTERYANVVVDSLDLSFSKDFAKCKVDLLAAFPDTSSLSSSYSQDSLFALPDLSATFGTSLAVALGTQASTTLTSDTTAPTDQSTVTLGSSTYKFVTSLSAGGTVANEVLIGISAAVALDNLKSAVNATAGSGTTYGSATVANPFFTATTNTDTTQVFQAIASGTAANSFATTQAGTSHCTWPGLTVNSGTPGTAPTPTPLVDFQVNIANSVMFEDAFLSGSNQPVAGGFVAGPLTVKGSYTVQFADTVELAKYEANTNNALIVTVTGASLGTIPTYEKIVLKFGKLVLTKAPIVYAIDGMTMVKQEFEVQYDATDHELSAIITNGYVGTLYQ